MIGLQEALLFVKQNKYAGRVQMSTFLNSYLKQVQTEVDIVTIFFMKVAIKYGLNGPNIEFSFIINKHKNLHQ